MDEIKKAIEQVMSLCNGADVPVTIIFTDKEENGQSFSFSGNKMDQAMHFMALESAMKENGLPIEVQKMIATMAEGDPSKVCSCPNCMAKRATEAERNGSAASEEDIKEMVFTLLRGDI